MHGAQHRLPSGIMLYDSYHCSRYNTQTKRMNEANVPRRIQRNHRVFAQP